MPASRSVNVCVRLLSQSNAHSMGGNRNAHSSSQLAGKENVSPMWGQSSFLKELRVMRKWFVIRGRRILLRNREYVQGESATKGNV